jgi:coatomer protein complex subunit alpha (xenin)
MGKRTAIQTFRRENDRFWVLTAHPELNLFAAGHDSGLIVFKLDRERPAFSIHGNTLFYIRDKHVRAHDLNSTNSDSSVISVRKLGNQYTNPRTISYNPAERAVIVTSVSLQCYKLCLSRMNMADYHSSRHDSPRTTACTSLYLFPKIYLPAKYETAHPTVVAAPVPPPSSLRATASPCSTRQRRPSRSGT